MNTVFLLMAQCQKACLTIEETARLFEWSPKTAHNRLSLGTFPVPTFKIGDRSFVRIQDIADYIDGQAAVCKTVRR